MKKLNIFLIACCASWGLTSCVQDLNTEPINPNILQKFDQDRIYYKIYASLGTTGQQGPSGQGDIDGNEGYGCFYRAVFFHNELPTDVGWWVWRDAGVPELNEMKFNDENEFTGLLYNRTIYNVTLCNHFLDNTDGKSDAKTLRQRAEVTFFRCLNYYYLLDLFGNPPFTMTVQLDKPKQIEGGRPALYRWVVNQLLAAEDYLDENTEVYRVNKNAARLLLARLYLNAAVYKGLDINSPDPNDIDSAALYANKVMNNGKYKLTHHYAQMFMGDNDRNEGACEVIFAIPQDGDYIQSYGASSFLLSMTRGEGMWPAGSINKWECFRSSPTLVEAFCKPYSINYTTIKGSEREMPELLKDDRALLCNYVKASAENPDSVTFQTSMEGPADYGEGHFKKCWAICKWTGSYSNGQIYGKNDAFVDTDLPLFRVAEAYLTYAEAMWRKGNTGVALQTINDLRETRHADPLPDINKDVLLDEWLREFYCEGHRRIDLIRFGEFCGDNTTMKWEGHQTTKPAYYIVYPLPKFDIVANDNLVQNDGYTK